MSREGTRYTFTATLVILVVCGAAATGLVLTMTQGRNS